MSTPTFSQGVLPSSCWYNGSRCLPGLVAWQMWQLSASCWMSWRMPSQNMVSRARRIMLANPRWAECNCRFMSGRRTLGIQIRSPLRMMSFLMTQGVSDGEVRLHYRGKLASIIKSPRSASVAIFAMKLLSLTVIRFKVRTEDKLTHDPFR